MKEGEMVKYWLYSEGLKWWWAGIEHPYSASPADWPGNVAVHWSFYSVSASCMRLWPTLTSTPSPSSVYLCRRCVGLNHVAWPRLDQWFFCKLLLNCASYDTEIGCIQFLWAGKNIILIFPIRSPFKMALVDCRYIFSNTPTSVNSRFLCVVETLIHQQH